MRIIQRIIRRDGYNCVYCHKEVVPKRADSTVDRSDALEPDHIIPIAAADRYPNVPLNQENNLVVSCGECNSNKSNRPLKEWLEDPITKSRGINPDTIDPKVWRMIDALEVQKKLVTKKERATGGN